jgi:hypothetical protein
VFYKIYKCAASKSKKKEKPFSAKDSNDPENVNILALNFFCSYENGN